MKKISCISNPPFNMKWEIPIFAQLQNRFANTEIPPRNNANFAFVLTALEKADKSVFILPQNVLSTNDKKEKEIVKYLIEKNFIEAIIVCPEKMFESTNIQVCVLVLNKNKNTTMIEMIDASKECKQEKRYQRGQTGNKAHTNRMYEKEINVFEKENIKKIVDAINNRSNIKEFCKSATIEDIKNNNYALFPNRYIEENEKIEKTREYEDIIKDYNRIVKEKNKLKIVANEKVLNSLGMSDLLEDIKKSKELSDEMSNNLKFLNIEIEKEDFITISKSKNEIIIKNNDNDTISEIILFALKHWSQHMHFLNNEENRYLLELRDKLLPDLLSGKIDF